MRRKCVAVEDGGGERGLDLKEIAGKAGEAYEKGKAPGGGQGGWGGEG
jgi:hypothetical protein